MGTSRFSRTTVYRICRIERVGYDPLFPKKVYLESVVAKKAKNINDAKNAPNDNKSKKSGIYKRIMIIKINNLLGYNDLVVGKYLIPCNLICENRDGKCIKFNPDSVICPPNCRGQFWYVRSTPRLR